MGPTHKRKRSLKDTPVDISKMARAMEQLGALKEELAEIEETENEMSMIMDHFNKLEAILKKDVKLPKANFSSLKEKDLQGLAIQDKFLSFSEELKSLTQNPIVKANAEKLKDQLKEIYDHVNMEYEAGSRMIIDAVLLTIGRIAHQVDSSLGIAIFPEMRITHDKPIEFSNDLTISLTGIVDYTVIQYKDEFQNKKRLIGAGSGRRDQDIFKLAQCRLLLVEAKRNGSSLADHIPEAVGQALALAARTNENQVRFCLSNGQTWTFFVLKRQVRDWVYYQSAPMELACVVSDICEILVLVREWLNPTCTDLCIYD